MLVPDPGITGSSRDFASGPVIPNSLFPIATNVDVWLDGVLVDRAPRRRRPHSSAAARRRQFQARAISNTCQAIWHPWDDDLTVGPLGRLRPPCYRFATSAAAAGTSSSRSALPLPGDYDYSGTVGPEDYGVWKANFGSTTNLDADGNDDHIVDAADYTIWRNNLAAAPAPAHLLLRLVSGSSRTAGRFCCSVSARWARSSRGDDLPRGGAGTAPWLLTASSRHVERLVRTRASPHLTQFGKLQFSAPGPGDIYASQA